MSTSSKTPSSKFKRESESNSESDTPAWLNELAQRAAEIDRAFEGDLGLYVKDLATGREFSLRGDERWYIASGVKVPIALEVLRQIQNGSLTFDTRIPLMAGDYVDGAGSTNSHPPGTLLSIRYLLEQMLIQSDNTASDLLIKAAGLENVNRLTAQLTLGEFSEITTLANVRRLAYSGLHPQATKLTSRDLMHLKTQSEDVTRVKAFARVLGLKGSELKSQNMNDAFSAYYARPFNSATLRSYAKLLEDVHAGGVLEPEMTAWLLHTMSRVETGKKRIKASFPSGLFFAHKTGTQRGRVCDFGLAWDKTRGPSRPIVISACARGFVPLESAERALRLVGEAVVSAGLLKP